MPPSLALLLWFILLLALFRFDPARRKSVALWVPVMWLFIVGSRLPSQWISGGVGVMAEALEDGNSLDRIVYSALTILAIGVLMSRSFRWGPFFAQNLPLTALLLYALLSVIWSDFTFIAFKRWTRDLGNYLMVLVTLSDRQPLEAVRTVLRRLTYLLIPLSLLLVKYYPEIGMQYDSWTGAASTVGATTGKNMLGVLCLISGLFFFWDTVARWPERKGRQTKRIILVNLVLLSMVVRLITITDSATSRVCLVLGCLVIGAAHSGFARRHPGLLKALSPLCIGVYVVLTYGFDISGQLAGAVGRDPTLTGRTVIWNAVLSANTDPIVGTGYESFWLGPRLLWVWQLTGAGINEAHNGYLEVYLNLGIIGVVLLSIYLVASYRIACRRLIPFSNFASLSLALWLVVLFYNLTEAAAFKGQLMWDIFLLGAIVVPRGASDHRTVCDSTPTLLETSATVRDAVAV
jgi:exopolysaccharide production protein ExoQ